MKKKIGIFCPACHGDIGLCTTVLKYKDQLWGDCDIIWYGNLSGTDDANTRMDMLKYNDMIAEIRDWPAGIPHYEMKDQNGQLLPRQRDAIDCLKDLHNGYFAAPWAALPNPALDGVNYAEIPRRVFGADPSWEWHPYLCFIDDEKEMAREFRASLPYEKTVMLETSLMSANAHFSHQLIKNIMRECRNKWGNCNIIFASKVNNETKIGDWSQLIDDKGVVSAAQFTVRQIGLLHDHCDLFIGSASGITVSVSRWGGKGVPRVVGAGTTTNYSHLANGTSNEINCDNLSREAMEVKILDGVIQTLNSL